MLKETDNQKEIEECRCHAHKLLDSAHSAMVIAIDVNGDGQTMAFGHVDPKLFIGALEIAKAKFIQNVLGGDELLPQHGALDG